METPILKCHYRWSDIHDPNYDECQWAPLNIDEYEIGEVTSALIDENGEWVEGFDFIPFHNFMGEWDKENPNLKYYSAKTVDEAVLQFVYDENPIEKDDRRIQEYIREWMCELGIEGYEEEIGGEF